GPALPRFLLDTNVISETFKASPHPRVHDWLRKTPSKSLFVSVISLGELHYAVMRMPSGARRTRLEAWADRGVTADFPDRILPFERETAVIWGQMMRASGLAVGGRNPIDMQLAATAIQHKLVLATRNTQHFTPLGLDLLNPWTELPSIPK